MTRVDSVESAAAALRMRMARAIAGTGPSAARAWAPTPLWRRRRQARDDALVAHASTNALRRVQHAAREAHLEWQDGGDVGDAMRRLGVALSVAAEFDVS